MFWIVLFTIALLTGIAFDWIAVRLSDERITVSLELCKILPAIRKAKDSARSLVNRES